MTPIMCTSQFSSLCKVAVFLAGHVHVHVGMLKSNDPPAKRMKLEEEGGGDSRKEDEEEEEMEEGGGLEIPAGAQVTVKPLQTEAMETEKKAAMMRSGKTVEERQEEFKEMLLERGVR